MKNKIITAIAVTAPLLVAQASLPVAVSAQVPQIINYQGRVIAGGTNFDGTGQFKFALVNSGGTTNYWSNDGSAVGQPAAAVSLTVTKGLYSVLLGDTTIANMTVSVAPTVFNNSDVRLRVWFNDSVNGIQQLSPDQRLGAVGYALNAASSASGGLTWNVVSGTNQQASPNNGYIANNAVQVTVTLPASPSIGDTIRVSGAGVGGWKIAQNAGQSVIGANLGLVGVIWTPRESSRFWWSVASSSDGNKLVAVVNGGQIYTSTDSGASWTPRETDRSWQSVASSSDGSKLVAVAGYDQIYTSTDSGASWTPRETDRSWRSVASSSDGSKLVAVESGGQIYTSNDSGVSWTPREGNRFWQSVASSSDGSKLVAVVAGGRIYISTDSGVSWVPLGSPGIQTWVSVASSADGNKLVAVVSGGQIYTSNDSGMSWTPRESGRNWRSVASSSDGSKLVAVASEGQIYISNHQTTTAGIAGYLDGGQSAAVELQYIGNGQFLPLSHEGTIVGN